jgi:D-glycero-alpha-D-manno-heptose-7-phosphate kinase
MYIMIHPYFHDKIRIKYSKTEDVHEIHEIQHPLVRECLKIVGIERGIEIASIADVPAGTGLGSSSSFTVCLLHALYAYKGLRATKDKLARDACRIEIEILKKPIGKQDQYTASFGGLNYIRFNSDGTVSVDPASCEPDAKERLRKNLLMFYVGNERESSQILLEQKKNFEQDEKKEIMRKMVELAKLAKDSLETGQIENLGEILHEGWCCKKKMADNISSPELDNYYEKALHAGARGGKLLGAGGGGFFLFYCEQKYHNDVRNALQLRELDFGFDNEGSKIIYLDI